jgi:hypothetical protein
MKTLLVLCMAAVGCAENSNEMKLTVPVALFKAGAAQDQGAGVGVGAQLITTANIRRFADLNGWLVWYEGDPKMATEAKAGSGQRSSAQVKRNVWIPLLPFPSAKVRIINQSGKTVSLASVQVALKGSDGKTFAMYPSLAEVQARVTTDLLQSQPGLRGAKMDGAVEAKVGKVPYLDLKGEIPNGKAATAYVAFDLTAAGDVDEYLRANKLQLVVSHLGANAELTVPLEKKDSELVLICPTGQRSANLDRCRIEGESTDEESQQAAAQQAATQAGGDEGGGEGGGEN